MAPEPVPGNTAVVPPLLGLPKASELKSRFSKRRSSRGGVTGKEATLLSQVGMTGSARPGPSSKGCS